MDHFENKATRAAIRRLLVGVCAAVLGVILTLGLWPFHAPKNGVAWMGDRHGLQFAKYATVMSSGAFPVTTGESAESAESRGPGSLEIWLQPRRVWDSATLLAFYTPGDPRQFSLRQSQADLELQTNTARLYVGNVFRRPGPVFLTVVSGVHGTVVYANGVPARTALRFQLSPNAFTGRLIMGDSPAQPDNWAGRFRGLAIYRRELTAMQVLRHYRTWTQAEQPEISSDESNAALYLFNERAGAVVRNQARSSSALATGPDLYIPERYTVLDKILLEPFWKEFSMSRSYWSSVFKNVIGFVPFGFCFLACLSAHQVRRAALATVILGFLVSLTIEVLQGYLPTRDSGTSDIITNTLGTYLGATAFRAVSPILAARAGSAWGSQTPDA